MSRKTASQPSSSSSPVTFMEPLEQRTLLSAPVSHTSLHLSAGKTPIGKDFTLTITVTGTKGDPVTGTAELLIDNNDVGGLTLTNGKASYTFGPGNFALYAGKHTFVATYQGNGTLPTSGSRGVSETITTPKLITTASGLKYAVVKKGTGTAVSATGATANVLYTGFLASNGTIFDFSAQHASPPTPLPVAIGQHTVVPGFEEGVTGMKIGEERVMLIPAALGYGASGSGSIPPNADLVFIVRLVSLS